MSDDKDPDDDFLENLEQPDPDLDAHHGEFRLTLLNTRRSAILGVLFMLLPLLFLSGVVFKHYLGLDLGLLTSVYAWISRLDERYGDHSLLNWVLRFLLTVGPLLAIALNLMAILHVRYEPSRREIVLSLKLRWVNVLIIAACSLLFLVFFSYLIVENAGGS